MKFFHSAWQVEVILKLRNMMRAKGPAAPIPTPPSGSRGASSPDSAFFPPVSTLQSKPLGAASKTMKTRQPSPGPRKTHDLFIYTAGVSFLLADLLSLPNGTGTDSPRTCHEWARPLIKHPVVLQAYDSTERGGNDSRSSFPANGLFGSLF